MKRITIALMLSLTFACITISAMAQEKWEIDMQKDFAKVLKAKKDAAQKHREYIVEWRKNGHLADVTLLYEAQKANYVTNAAFIYGLGYAYALTDIKENPDAENYAISHYETALQLDPSMFWAHFSLGAIYQRQEKYEQALTKFKTSLTLNPNYYPAHYYIGEIHLKQDNYTEAFQSFEAAQALNPKWEYPVYGIGLVYFDQGSLNQARETFERAIQNNRKFAPAYIKLGQVLAKEGFFDEALKEYQKAAEIRPYTAQDVYELAVIFAEGGNIDGAVQLYRRTLEIDPRHPQAHYAIADALYAQGDRDTAVTHYRLAIEGDPALKNNIYKPIEPYYIGILGANQARELMDKAKAILPEDPRSYFYMAKLEADTGNTDKAIELYKKTLELIEKEPSYLDIQLPQGHFNDSHIYLGDLYRKKGNLDVAATYYRRALELDPTLANKFIEQGKTAFQSENYKEAIEPLNIHVILFPEDIEATYLLGQSYEGHEDSANALTYYQKTLELDSNRSDVLYKMADIHIRSASHQKALETLKKIITIDPADAQAHYLSAQSYLALEQHEAALSSYLETIRLKPDNVDAQYQAGKLYENKGDIDNAIVYYEKTIELDPENAEPFFKLGGIYETRKDEDNMIRVYQPALILDPNHPKIHHTLAAIFDKRSKNGEKESYEENINQAIHHYGLANEHDPEQWEWHYQFARLLDTHAETLEDYHLHGDMAVTEYTNSIKLNPGHIDSFFYRGLLTNRYKRIKDTFYLSEQIINDFMQVVTLDPKRTDAYYHMGILKVWIEKFDQAKAAFQKVLQLNPKYKGVHTQLGKLAEREQKWKEAIKLYEKEIEIDEKAVTAYQRLGDLYYNSALEYNKAKAMLEIALNLNDKHVDTLIVYANVLYSMDKLGSAAEQFERVIQIDKRNLTANYNLALMYEYTDRFELARTQWKRFLELNPPEQWKVEANNHLSKLAGK